MAGVTLGSVTSYISHSDLLHWRIQRIINYPLGPKGRFQSEAEKELSARPKGTLSKRSGERIVNSEKFPAAQAATLLTYYQLFNFPLGPKGRFQSEAEKELSILKSSRPRKRRLS